MVLGFIASFPINWYLVPRHRGSDQLARSA
jgi:hypothetical protein